MVSPFSFCALLAFVGVEVGLNNELVNGVVESDFTGLNQLPFPQKTSICSKMIQVNIKRRIESMYSLCCYVMSKFELP